MLRSTLSFGFGGAFALVVTIASPAANADTIRYSYVALDQVPLPAPYTFFSPSVVVDGRVFGTAFDSSFTIAAIAEYVSGKFTIGAAGTAVVANSASVVGGSDPSSQAALFKGTVTTLVPRLPGESSASVVGLTEDNLALVQSTNAAFATTYAYFRRGSETVINFGLPDPVFGAFMNEDGVIGLTKQESPTDHFLRGFRYEPRTGKSTLLPPFAGDPTDVLVLVQGINTRGEVLGYSYANGSGSAYHERVGVWDTAGVFKPYVYETITTNTLVFNDRNQIVISNSSDLHSYFVPAPGSRLDLASLVRNMPAGLDLVQAVSIDNDGNITGLAEDPISSNFFPFLLKPLGEGEADPAEVTVRGFRVPSRVAQGLDKSHPHK